MNHYYRNNHKETWARHVADLLREDPSLTDDQIRALPWMEETSPKLIRRVRERFRPT